MSSRGSGAGASAAPGVVALVGSGRPAAPASGPAAPGPFSSADFTGLRMQVTRTLQAAGELPPSATSPFNRHRRGK